MARNWLNIFLSLLLAALLCLHWPTGEAVVILRSREGQLLDIVLPRVVFEEFSYKPTRDGYIYRYKLPDGTTREEIGYIPGAQNADLLATLSRNNRDRPVSRPRTKNRKLSPKSLQSLAG